LGPAPFGFPQSKLLLVGLLQQSASDLQSSPLTEQEPVRWQIAKPVAASWPLQEPVQQAALHT